MILELLLYSYLITTCISASVMPVRAYIMGKDKHGKRKSIMVAIQIYFLCYLPYIAFVACVYVTFKWSKKSFEDWVNQDPTAPKNINDPDFVPPPKKEKKFKPIKDRFDILDL